ncbi:MAG: SDR family NAD(P)-dependent oxidoreductase, partial [Verrucomicrobiota bacterium]
MNILVTGGAGFIGSHICRRLLSDGHAVTLIDDFNDYYDPAIKRGNVAALGGAAKVVEGDIRDRGQIQQLFAEGKFETVIHIAARAGVRPSVKDPQLYIDTNITGTHHLLEASRQNAVKRFIFASSSSVYGLA